MGFVNRYTSSKLWSLTFLGLVVAFIYHLTTGGLSIIDANNARWKYQAGVTGLPEIHFYSSAYFPKLSDFRKSPNDVIVRSVYFDDRMRDGHSNATVFLLEVDSKIIDNKLFSGCRAGEFQGKFFQVRDCFLNSWLRTSNTYQKERLTHWCIMLDCFDLPAGNGSRASVSYQVLNLKYIKRGEWDSVTHHVHRTVTVDSPTPLIFPPPYKPAPNNKDDFFTIAVCRGPVFGTPPYFSEWITYQRTIGVDHIYLIIEESFIHEKGLETIVLSNAIAEGFVSYRIWETKRDDVRSHYRSQIIANQDCLYRMRGWYDYVFIADTDDFFTPVTVQKSLHYYVNMWCHRNTTCGALNMRWIQFHTECGMKEEVPLDGNVTRLLASHVNHTVDINNKVNYKTVHRVEASMDIMVHKHGVFLSGYSHVLLPMNKAFVAHVREHQEHEGTRCAQSFAGLNYFVRCLC